VESKNAGQEKDQDERRVGAAALPRKKCSRAAKRREKYG
jgi:hypothetical protein